MPVDQETVAEERVEEAFEVKLDISVGLLESSGLAIVALFCFPFLV